MRLLYSNGPLAGQEVVVGTTLVDGVTTIISIDPPHPLGSGRVQYQRVNEHGEVSGLEVHPADLGLHWQP